MSFTTFTFKKAAAFGNRILLTQKLENRLVQSPVDHPYFGTAYFHLSSILNKRRKTIEERKMTRIIEYSPKSKAQAVDVWRGITVTELAQKLDKNVSDIKFLLQNITGNSNATNFNDVKILNQTLSKTGHKMNLIKNPHELNENKIEDDDLYPRPPPLQSMLVSRPPIVTVMGHVDHGKTTLLDALRESNVVDQEFGGITQHIGAFSVKLSSGSRITFLDTPGHAAFASMRARGANLTDIVVLVVAADDGVMEQTVESIKMARAANVPMLIAINKIDMPKADIERTHKTLLNVGIQVEQLGGDTQAIPISALKKRNLNDLLEALIVQAELLEIKADPTGLVEGVIVESKVHPHRGKLCTMVVKRGTLKKGAILLAGTSVARVRVLRDAEGNIMSKAEPGYPVEIDGWKELPPAGELILEADSERRAKLAVKARETKITLKKQEEEKAAILEKIEIHQKEYKKQLNKKRKLGFFKLRKDGPRKSEFDQDESDELTYGLIFKGDVDGTVEAVLDTLSTYDSKLCDLDLLTHGVGAITENELELAHAFNATIYTFNLKTPNDIKRKAEELQVQIKEHNVIYKLVDDIKEEITNKLPLKDVEEILGEATVLKKIFINEKRKKVPVMGCKCTKGLLKSSAMYRLMRNGNIIYTGTLSSMRHLKSEVSTIALDLECGLQFSDNTVTFEEGDTLICYEMKKEPQILDWDPGF